MNIKNLSQRFALVMPALKSILLLTLVSTSALAAEWQVEVGLGNAINKTESFTIFQDSHPNMVINDAELKTHGTDLPPYYSFRVSRWDDNKAWELEHVHHKLYLDNSTDYDPRLYNFEVTDGYNLFMLNRVKPLPWGENTYYRFGGGIVFTHPDIYFDDDTDGTPDRSNFSRGNGWLPTVWLEGYHLGGYVVQAAVQKVVPFGEHHRFSVESKLVHGEARIPVDDGHVYLPNTSIHFLVLYAYRF